MDTNVDNNFDQDDDNPDDDDNMNHNDNLDNNDCLDNEEAASPPQHVTGYQYLTENFELPRIKVGSVRAQSSIGSSAKTRESNRHQGFE